MNGWIGFAALAALVSLAPAGGIPAAADALSVPTRGNAYWLYDRQAGCYVFHSDPHAADAVSWYGACVDRRANGLGTAVFSSHGHFVGTLSAKYVEGVPAAPVSANWADAGRSEALPVAMPAAITKPAGQALSAASPVPSTPRIPAWLQDASGRNLMAVDGTRFALMVSSRQLALDIATPNTLPQKTIFTFVNASQGTVSNGDDGTHVTGTFRLTDAALEIAYEDGRTEKLARKGDGSGVVLTTVFASGSPVCVIWYPEGHGFTTAERQAAVAAYAVRLGIGSSGAGTIASCTDGGIEAEVAPPSAEPDKPGARPHRSAKAKTALADGDARDATIFVRNADVHLIDPPFAPAVETQEPGVWRVASHPALATPAQPSECLSVATEGASWGFRNRCGFAVSFAYCLNDPASDPLSCSAGTTAGSVAPNTFGPLFAQKNLNDSEHDFRWIACDAGNGAVTPKLVRADPPAGQCLKTKTS
ncbi:MAG: hypothetical protein JO056_12515 [Alphaproteobacteria bacterium]|nr:hypothetical protein [Alphaproteobacteria bacterium]